MAKSIYAEAVDALQSELRAFFKQRSFKVKGRTYNRVTEDGLTQVLGIQVGPSDPPGTTYHPGTRENLHGLFTVNLGVYVPEVARHLGGTDKAWIQDYHCCVRSRLGQVGPEKSDLWWHAIPNSDVTREIRERVDRDGIPFLDRYSSRDRILAEWQSRSENLGPSSPPRIVLAIILAERGEVERARALLALQVQETRNPGHPAYVRKLAQGLGVGSLDA